MNARDAWEAVRQMADCPRAPTNQRIAKRLLSVSQMAAHVRPGDTPVGWRLDRPGRSLKHLIETVNDLAARGIGFKWLTEQIDTPPSGKLVFHVFGALAEFERDLIRERTHAGLAAARAWGRTGGRPKTLADPKQLALAKRLYADGQPDVATICKTLGISRLTLYRSVQRPDRAKDPTL